MMDMWNAMDAVQRALVAIAAPATVLLAAEFVMLLVGLCQGGAPDDADMGDGPDADMEPMDGVDADADADIDAGDGPDAAPARGADGLRWFTLLGVASLLAVTGWGGLALMEAALPAALAVALALAMGVGAMYLCALAMRSFRRLGERGNLTVASAVGKFAEVYLPIPPGRAAGGKVMLKMQGRLVELDAVTDGAEALPTGARVVVKGLAGDGAVLVRAARATGTTGDKSKGGI
ncbi:MAG: hypothetical protein ACI4P5_05875 [Candidatus Fimadaptatus sp.]